VTTTMWVARMLVPFRGRERPAGSEQWRRHAVYRLLNASVSRCPAVCLALCARRLSVSQAFYALLTTLSHKPTTRTEAIKER
jgi:hypothetical protein